MDYWHNPRCAKSREALALLRERGVEPRIRAYLQDPPSVGEIGEVLTQLGFDSARQLMRTKEALYRELGLKSVTDETALIAALAEHPKLIERPILIVKDKAVLGRPPEQVLTLL